MWVLLDAGGEDVAVPEPSGHLFVTGSCLAFPKFSFFQSLVLSLAESRCDLGVMPRIQMWSVDPLLRSTSWTLLSRCWLLPKDGEQTAILSLFLKHLNTAASRIEDYSRKNRECFDIVTSRAVAKLNTLLEISVPLVKVVLLYFTVGLSV